MPLQSGSRLGPYEIVGALGAGGMGEVYRARDSRLGREVAIKTLPGELATDEMRLRRFEHEARAASALNHPNILSVFDVGSDHDIDYLVTELVAGVTLRERLGGGALGAREVVDIGAQIADGLAAAHTAGLVHRDVKPENVMITGDGRVKILDFGLAKPLIAEASAQATRTIISHPGMVVGTIGYVSPEQVRGGEVDARSDIFSLGLVLYEMTAGQRPFNSPTTVETLNAILKDPGERPARRLDCGRSSRTVSRRIPRDGFRRRRTWRLRCDPSRLRPRQRRFPRWGLQSIIRSHGEQACGSGE